MTHSNPLFKDDRQDTLDYITAMRVLKPDNPRDSNYKERVKAWQTLLNVGKKWHIKALQEDYPEGVKLFDEMGKALTRKK
mgnify:CR=1 FL=1